MKKSTDPPPITTLEELIAEFGPAGELAKELDYTMLYLVHLVRHEPAYAPSIIAPYEILRELRNLLQTYNPVKP